MLRCGTEHFKADRFIYGVNTGVIVLNESVTLFTSKALPVMEEVDIFYRHCQRKAAIDPKDDLVLAYIGDELAGVFSLCEEQQFHTLRIMQIKPNMQRRGLGRLILERFETLLREPEIKEIFSMPYPHLEYFYSLIGFRKIQNLDAPEFLLDRLKEFESKNPNQSVILMARRSL